VDDEFKLSSDETMRRLLSLAQSPGELQWRLELLDTLRSMRVQQEVYNKGILQMLGKVRKDVSHLTPTKIAELVNAQITEKLKPLEKEQSRMWKASMWLLEKAATIGIGVMCTLIGLKAIGK
jgi:predicted DNA-binding transcriptional regulator